MTCGLFLVSGVLPLESLRSSHSPFDTFDLWDFPSIVVSAKVSTIGRWREDASLLSLRNKKKERKDLRRVYSRRPKDDRRNYRGRKASSLFRGTGAPRRTHRGASRRILPVFSRRIAKPFSPRAALYGDRRTRTSLPSDSLAISPFLPPFSLAPSIRLFNSWAWPRAQMPQICHSLFRGSYLDGARAEYYSRIREINTAMSKPRDSYIFVALHITHLVTINYCKLFPHCFCWDNTKRIIVYTFHTSYIILF